MLQTCDTGRGRIKTLCLLCLCGVGFNNNSFWYCSAHSGAGVLVILQPPVPPAPPGVIEIKPLRGMGLLAVVRTEIGVVNPSAFLCENPWTKTGQLRFLLRRNDKVQRSASTMVIGT
jgi:hypothetical protein